MITAIDYQTDCPDPSIININGKRYNPETWKNILKRGIANAGNIKACQEACEILWLGFLACPTGKIDLNKTYTEMQEKPIAIAQLHAKTPEVKGTLRAKLDSLKKRIETIATNTNLSWEEKLVLTQECLPEKCAGKDLVSPRVGISQIGSTNGLLYTDFTAKVPVIVLATKVYTSFEAILIAGYTPNPQKTNTTTNLILGNRAMCGFISQAGNTVIISTQNPGLPVTPQGSIYCGPNQASFLGTALRTVIALTNITHTPLNMPAERLAARLALRLNTFTITSDKDISNVFARLPNHHGRFPHEDAIIIHKGLNAWQATGILESLAQEQ